MRSPCCPNLRAEVRELGTILTWALAQTPVDTYLLHEVAARALALGEGDGAGADLLADCQDAA